MRHRVYQRSRTRNCVGSSPNLATVDRAGVSLQHCNLYSRLRSSRYRRPESVISHTPRGESSRRNPCLDTRAFRHHWARLCHRSSLGLDDSGLRSSSLNLASIFFSTLSNTDAHRAEPSSSTSASSIGLMNSFCGIRCPLASLECLVRDSESTETIRSDFWDKSSLREGSSTGV